MSQERAATGDDAAGPGPLTDSSLEADFEATGVGFDKVLGRLRGVVERLENGELTLEESLKAFEEGVRLSRRGAEILDAAERRVDVLLKGSTDTNERVAPFKAPEDAP